MILRRVNGDMDHPEAVLPHMPDAMKTVSRTCLGQRCQYKSESCGSAFSVSETPVAGTSVLVVFLIVLGFLLVAVGNCVFCYWLKRKTLGGNRRGMEKVLEEEDVIEVENVETETALNNVNADLSIKNI
eukprot:282939_1